LTVDKHLSGTFLQNKAERTAHLKSAPGDT